MTVVLSEEQIDEALLLANAVMMAAGHSYEDPDNEADIRIAARGHLTFDKVVYRGAEWIRSRG